MPNPKTFAGYASPEAILRDVSLSTRQKQTALLHWRAALARMARIKPINQERQKQLTVEIDEALIALENHERTAYGRWLYSAHNENEIPPRDLVLSADFATVEDVLTSDLKASEKATILRTWLSDLKGSHSKANLELRQNIELALLRLSKSS
ncbi:hypothetical protein [Roseibium polysiphoniae]|uniref:hypothetical protein n=1 Tax=Roseibium polysiphoniae TaxID=2571221 RepID=UPI0032970094